MQDVLKKLLTDYGSEFLNIKAVYFDPYNECQNFRSEINGISFLVRPSVVAGNQKKSQLSHPSVLADEDDDFSKCEIFSLVAWDHVSWPGNDFYIGSRATDDGVKAAATNSMAVITGVDGKYDKFKGKYEPPMQFKNWLEVVQKLELCLWDSSVAWVPADMK